MLSVSTLGSIGGLGALSGLTVYTRINGVGLSAGSNTALTTPTEGSETSRDEASSRFSLNVSLLTNNRDRALTDLSTARTINARAASGVADIAQFLQKIDTQAEALSAAAGKGGALNKALRNDLIADINDFASQINQKVSVLQYEREAILGGTYSYSGQLNFNTTLFGLADLTSLPHFLDVNAESDQLGLSKASDTANTPQVQVNGQPLTSDATVEQIADFRQQIVSAQKQLQNLQKQIDRRDLHLNVRTSQLNNTRIEPSRLESENLSNNQRVIQKALNLTQPTQRLTLSQYISIEV